MSKKLISEKELKPAREIAKQDLINREKSENNKASMIKEINLLLAALPEYEVRDIYEHLTNVDIRGLKLYVVVQNKLSEATANELVKARIDKQHFIWFKEQAMEMAKEFDNFKRKNNKFEKFKAYVKNE